MRKLLLTLMLVAVCLPAAAQQSLWELYGGATYTRIDLSPDLKVLGLDKVNTAGWHGSLSEFVNPWFGAKVELSGSYARPTINIAANSLAPGSPPTAISDSDLFNFHTYTVMAGPTFAYRDHSRVEPFGHVLIGAARADTSPTSKGIAFLQGAHLSSTTLTSEKVRWGLALGGGSDYRLNTHLKARAEADWLRSTFPDFAGVTGDDRQNHLRISAGLVFQFRGGVF